MNRLNEIEIRMSEIDKALDQPEANLEALQEEIRSLKEEKAQIEKREAIRQEVANGGGKVIEMKPEVRTLEFDPATVLESPEYRSAWLKNLQGAKMTEIEERAYAAANVGGAIPVQVSDQLFAKMVKLAPMLSEITLLRVAGNVQFTTEGVRNDAYQHAENGAITAATDTLLKVSLTGYEYNKLLYVSKTVQTMSINAFEGWLVDMIAEDIAVAIENAIINGSGSTAPKGIEYAGTWTADTNLVVCTGTFVLTYADVLKQIALLPARYDSNAKFLCSKAMLYQGLANVVDTQKRPILITDASQEHPHRVLGYPVIVSDKVAAKTLYLGDFKKVVGNLSSDVMVEKDASAGFASNSIAYRGGAVFDCNIALPDAFVKLTVNTY